MAQVVIDALFSLAQILEIIGAAALILGFVVATLRCILQISVMGIEGTIGRYRRAIGRVVLMGLEILIAVTIVKTIIFGFNSESLGLLAIMIAIRMTLGWSLDLETNGRWPWQKSP